MGATVWKNVVSDCVTVTLRFLHLLRPPGDLEWDAVTFGADLGMEDVTFGADLGTERMAFGADLGRTELLNALTALT